MRQSKKCLIVYPFFAHYRLHILRELMCRSDWEFELVSDTSTSAGIKGIDPSLAHTPLNQGGMRWTFVKNRYFFGKSLPLVWQHGLLERLGRDDYDAVIFLGSIYFMSTWLGIQTAKQKGARVLLWTHGFLTSELGVLGYVRHKFYGKSDCCLLYGERALNIMLNSGKYTENQLRVIYNSLDYSSMNEARLEMTNEKREAIRETLFPNTSAPILVAIGRLNAGKKLDLLVDAVNELRKNGIEVRCLVVGDGDQRETLTKKVDSLALREVFKFYGSAYGGEADRLLLASDLCVIPGDVGLSVMHAFAAGLPVVTHDRFLTQGPEHEAISEGKTGSFYRYGSVSSLTESIAKWLANLQFLEEAKDACYAEVNGRYNVDYQVRSIIEALDKN